MPNQCPQCGITLRETDPPGPCPDCLDGAIPETVVTMAAAVSSSTHPAAVAHDSESDRFGPYTLMRLIGEGGMGAVYLAEQVRPIRRQVALKVVKLGMDSRQVLARFDSERQSLAMMDHPNIARVFDAGTSAAGRPYFVMEWVDGVAIGDFCDHTASPLASTSVSSFPSATLSSMPTRKASSIATSNLPTSSSASRTASSSPKSSTSVSPKPLTTALATVPVSRNSASSSARPTT
jgi:hypothetical protein